MGFHSRRERRESSKGASRAVKVMIQSTTTTAMRERMVIKLQRCALLGVLAATLGGCVIGPDAKPGDPAYAPVSAPAMLPPPANQGGIYQSNGGLSLFED